MQFTRFAIVMLSALFVLTACSNRKESSVADPWTKSLSMQDDLILPLDSSTSQQTPYMQLVNDSSLAIFNAPMSEICIYNIHSRQLSRKIKIYREGPNAVNGCEAFFYQNNDSIWFYAPWGKRIFLLDDHGVVKDKRNISKLISNSPVYPYPMTDAPYIVRNNSHFLQGMAGNSNESKTNPAASIIYDYQANTISYANKYPEIYGNPNRLFDNWDKFAYLQTSYTLSPENEIITSFHASDSIYVFNLLTETYRSYYAGYSHPLSISAGIANSQDAKIQDFIEGSQYAAILYDRFNNLYYRLVRLPLEDYNHNNLRMEILRKPLAIIILNKDFNIIGEYELPNERYYTSHIFVNSEGININVLSDDDDFLRFKVFKPIELQ